MPQITINLGNVEAAAVAAAAANAGISDQAFVEQIVQAHLASMAPQHGPTFTREGGMLISALAQTGATAGKVFNLGDILKAWGIADPTNNVADLKKGTDELAAMNLITFDAVRNEMSLTQAGETAARPYR